MATLKAMTVYSFHLSDGGPGARARCAPSMEQECCVLRSSLKPNLIERDIKRHKTMLISMINQLMK